MLYSLVSYFRSAIERAVDSGELREYPFYKFPDNCCDMTCDLLSQYLNENDIETVQIKGVHKDDPQLYHVWLQTVDGIVIDITADQFLNKFGMPKDINSIHVGKKEGSIHKVFCKNRQYEANTEFIGAGIIDMFGIPNKRKQDLFNAYEIVCKYL